jgi:hypothetical protein
MKHSEICYAVCSTADREMTRLSRFWAWLTSRRLWLWTVRVLALLSAILAVIYWKGWSDVLRIAVLMAIFAALVTSWALGKVAIAYCLRTHDPKRNG